MDKLVQDLTRDLLSYLKLNILMYTDDTYYWPLKTYTKYLDTLNIEYPMYLKITTSRTKISGFLQVKFEVVIYSYLGVSFNLIAKCNVVK